MAAQPNRRNRNTNPGERAERVRLEAALGRTEEQLLNEQVRASIAEERWQPLIRQRDEGQRERSRAARALSAVHAERRELQWAIGDLRHRVGTPALHAWETPHASRIAAVSVGAPRMAPWEQSWDLGSRSSTFSSSPYGRPVTSTSAYRSGVDAADEASHVQKYGGIEPTSRPADHHWLVSRGGHSQGEVHVGLEGRPSASRDSEVPIE